MAYIDEEIAKLRRKKEREEKQAEEEKNKPVITEEELIEAIKQGEVKIGERSVFFEPVKILDNRLLMYFPVTSFVTQSDTKEIYQIMDDAMELSFQFFLSEEKKGEFESLAVYKENMVKKIKPSGVQFQWIEEESMLISNCKLQYLEFVNVTGLGIIYNVMLFLQTDYGQLIGNMNFSAKDKEFWRPVMKALVKLIEVVAVGD